jgi:hypothetical protein
LAVFDALLPFYDADLDSRVAAAELTWREMADATLKAHPSYKGVGEQITALWESANAAASELHREQRQAAQVLQDSVPPPPELPQAEPSGEMTLPLFDSEADFFTATRQLIRHKRLIGLNGDDSPSEDVQ